MLRQFKNKKVRSDSEREGGSLWFVNLVLILCIQKFQLEYVGEGGGGASSGDPCFQTIFISTQRASHIMSIIESIVCAEQTVCALSRSLCVWLYVWLWLVM